MSAAVIGVVLLILAAIGVGVYFMFFVKKECKEYETQADCKKPCKWDTYGGKCIGKDGDMTPAPPTPPSDDETPTPPSGDYVMGRYVRLKSTTTMRINEIMVYDDKGELISHGNNMVSGSASTTLWGPATKLYDLQLADHPFHTGSGSDEYVQLDMGKMVKISKVVVVNQSYHREVMKVIDGTIIKILDEDEQSVAEETIRVYGDDDAAENPIFVFLPKSQTIVNPNTIALSKPAKVRYIDIKSKNGKFLVLGELEVYNSAGENIALGKTVTMSSTHHPSWAGHRLVDGDISTEAHTAAHTAEQGTDADTITVDLGSTYSIKGLRIYARTAHDGAYKSHANRIWVNLRNQNGQHVINTTRTDGDHKWYDFKFMDIPTNWTTSSD